MARLTLRMNNVTRYFAEIPFVAQAFAQVVIVYLDDCFAAGLPR